jgi:hypothetical protein
MMFHTGLSEPGVPWPPLADFGRSVNPISTRWAVYNKPNYYFAPFPGFSDFHTALPYISVFSLFSLKIQCHFVILDGAGERRYFVLNFSFFMNSDPFANKSIKVH